MSMTNRKHDCWDEIYYGQISDVYEEENSFTAEVSLYLLSMSKMAIITN